MLGDFRVHFFALCNPPPQSAAVIIAIEVNHSRTTSEAHNGLHKVSVDCKASLHFYRVFNGADGVVGVCGERVRTVRRLPLSSRRRGEPLFRLVNERESHAQTTRCAAGCSVELVVKKNYFTF